MDKKKINSIAEMCELSDAFSKNICLLNTINKHKDIFPTISDVFEIIRYYEQRLMGITEVYHWDMNRAIDTEAIEKEIAELKEKVIQEYEEKMN